ncbi:MAG: glycerate kinase [Clostridia bacterium]|jgi:glycerate 2-kinase|nr:glycerate kinase [Clostridia bacterium]
MKKCLVIPDSFKGTMSATQICEIYKKQLAQHFPQCEVKAVPVADGGEGTVDCFLYALPDCEKIAMQSADPFGEPCDVYYARRGDTAIIEMAMCAGLPQVEGRENPELTSTYGVGAMIAHAMENGCTEILLGLGGSCTNDCGTGMAEALGVKFYDENGNILSMAGGKMGLVKHIDTKGANPLLKSCKITAMCDIDNPLCGETGAAYMFGPQKGADAEMVKRLDAGLAHIAEIVEKDLGKKTAHIRGAGAAGGMGAGVVAFLGGELKQGIDAVLDVVGYDEMLDGADVVFTGEGRIDEQSLHGKVVVGVAGRAAKRGVPVVAIVGCIEPGAEGAYDMGVSAIFSTNRRPEPFETARLKCTQTLEATIGDVLRLWKARG